MKGRQKCMLPAKMPEFYLFFLIICQPMTI